MTYEIHSLKELKALRHKLKSNQALMSGKAINGSLVGVISTKDRRFGRTLSRSLDCFQHPQGEGILTIDYDPRAGTEPLSKKVLVTQLHSVIPALCKTQLLWATSAGSCIFDARTGKELIGVKGQRIYIIVKNGSDITRALNVLMMRLWLAGCGYIKVSKSGQKLKRTIVDVALANPVQPDFAAGAVCIAPLEQRSEDALIGQGGPLDTLTAVPDLTLEESNQLAKLYADAEDAVVDEVKAARELWLNEHCDRAVQRATAKGKILSEEEITAIRDSAMAALECGILTGNFVITLPDGTEVTVNEILKNPARYHCSPCFDPIEPDYDNFRVVGKIYTNKTPTIFSYAHGGQTFKLVRQQTAIEWRDSDSALAVLATCEVLREAGCFYDYGNRLVHVELEDIHVVTQPTALFYLGQQIRYWYMKPVRGGSFVKTNCDPPVKLATQMLDLGTRRGLRKLTGISDVPIILPTGKVISANGYDVETGIIFIGVETYTIPLNPSKDKVRAALALLWKPVSLFPFADEGARTCCLTAILTAVIRRGISTAPGIAVDAPQRGTGKTLLTQAIFALYAGRNPNISPLATGQSRDDELRKKIKTTLLEGRDHIIFDNITGNFDSQVLAALLTSGMWTDRILGKSQEYSGYARLLIAVNGNNISLVGDLARRFIPIRLIAGVENPFDRHFDFDPVEFVLENREELTAAAITAIRGWFAAGSPGAESAGVGSFDDWGKLVRGPLRWFAQEGLLPFEGYRDPIELLVAATESDPEQEEWGEVLAALNRVLSGQSVSAKSLIEILTTQPFGEDKTVVNQFLNERCRNGLTSKSVGKVLTFQRDKPARGLVLTARDNRDDVSLYSVLPARDAG